MLKKEKCDIDVIKYKYIIRYKMIVALHTSNRSSLLVGKCSLYCSAEGRLEDRHMDLN
jgi:hypothetical protein